MLANRRLFALLVLSVLAAGGSASALPASSWSPLPGLHDQAYVDATDLTAELARQGLVAVELPWPVRAAGLDHSTLLIGEGFVQLARPAGASGSSEPGPRLLGLGSDLVLGPRIDVLAAPDLMLAPDGRLLLSRVGGRLGLRWTALTAPGLGATPAIAELLIDSAGGLTAQYLHLPGSFRSALSGGRLQALRTAGAPPLSATAWRLRATPFEPGRPGLGEPPGLHETGPPPNGCDPESGTWCDRTGAGCADIAGTTGLSACTDTVSTNWSFNEQAYCSGCDYTFYVLVECGREMHLPFDDMEGMEIQVTEMITGNRPSLRCLNDAARGNAPEVIRCVGPGGSRGYGPAFDQTDANGRISWGFPDCVSAADLSCADIPPGGGTVDRVSPGEFQVMDCYIEADSGLCGLYRVDIRSGGFQWELFANCDGTNSPQFEIFTDCTAAWAALEPLPEFAIANAVILSTCPDIQVEFDVQNLGCVDHVGGVNVRLTSDCVPADVVDHFVPDLIPAGGSVTVVVPFTSSCSPVGISIAVDPDDVVPECTESPTVAACRQEQGLDSLTAFGCGCTAALSPDAGPDRLACDGELVTLDGSASVAAPCAQPLYRWLDATGAEVQAASPSPTLDVNFTDCPAGAVFTLELSCQGETCFLRDDVRIDCFAPVAEAGPDVLACAGEVVILDGSASQLAGCARPLYRWLDGTGAEVRPFDPDPLLDLGFLACTAAGTYTLEVSCLGASCSATDTVVVDCVEVVAAGGPDLRTCEGEAFTIDTAGATATGCALVEYRWIDADTLAPLTAFDPDPSFGGTLTGCPGTLNLLLEARCADPGAPACSSFDDVVVNCPGGGPQSVAVTTRCDITGADLSCGTAAPGTAYYWDLDLALDTSGNGIPDDDPDLIGCDVTATWPGSGTRTVRLIADAGGCRDSAQASFEVFSPPATPSPSALDRCGGAAVDLFCGGDPNFAHAWDLDLLVDSDGNGSSDDDADLFGCDVTASWPGEGPKQVRVLARNGQGCLAAAVLDIEVFADPAPAPAASPGCPGEPTSLSCGTAQGGLTITWDLDTSVDSSGNGIPDDDADATGCDVGPSYGAGPFTASVTATDARGCSVTLPVSFDVVGSGMPSEVSGLRITRVGSRLDLDWQAAAGAGTYQVLRGDLGTWYDHAADDAAGRGACDTLGALRHSDPDDLADGLARYYLVVGVSGCGGAVGPPGFGRSDVPYARPAPSAACP